MNCSHCNASLNPHASFCGSCGQAVDQATSVTSQTAPSIVSPALAVAGPPTQPPPDPRGRTPGWKRPGVLWSGIGAIVVVVVVVLALVLVPSRKTIGLAAQHNSPTTSLNSAASSQATWSSGQQIDTNSNNGRRPNNYLDSVSCPTRTFCVAVDDGGYAFIYSGGTWSSGQQIDGNGLHLNTDSGLNSTSERHRSAILVATAPPAFPRPLPNALLSISCPTTTFCAAVDVGGYEFTYSGGNWSSGQPIAKNNNALMSVACSSTAFCVAVDSGGYEYTYSKGAWTSGQQIDSNNTGDMSYPNNALTSVSCATNTFCMAVDHGGDEFTYSGGTWSDSHQISVAGELTSVSCATKSFCVVIDLGGYTYTYSGGKWSSSTMPGRGTNEISCRTASFCVSVDYHGFGFTYSGGAWSSGQQIGNVLDSNDLLSISCPTISFCVGVGKDGYAFTYSKGTAS